MNSIALQIAQALFFTTVKKNNEDYLPECTIIIEDVDTFQEIVDKIDNMMENHNLFLDANLTIKKLAELIGTNRTYVSKALAQKKEMNFTTYINTIRLMYANRLAIGREITVCQLSELSGFKSERTFYRILKECNLSGTELLKKRYICENLLK